MKRRLIAIDGLDASGKMTQTELLKDLLEAKGIPYLNIETDYSQADSGQISTRLSAFLETME